jgi:hypothetical protein
MTTAAWAILIIAVAAIAIALAIAWKLQRTRRLSSRFGPEYDNLVRQRGNASRAERELEYRAKRVEKFHIRPLTQAECDRFTDTWRQLQRRFVDDPRRAMADAERLIHEVMRTRGYPVGAVFEENAADLSVDHPVVVERYRAAHTIAAKEPQGQTDTEELRQAFQHDRALFEDLINRPVGEYGEVHR